MKTRLLKLIDRLVGTLVTVCSSPSSVSSIPEVRSIMFIRPGGIGDAVLLSTAIYSLKRSCPECHITVLAEQRNAGIFQIVSGVDVILCYDRALELVQALQTSCDVVIDTEQWYYLSAVVARLVRAPVKIGFATNERRRMFTHKIEYDLNAQETDNFFALLEPLGVDGQQPSETADVQLPQQSVSRACQLLQPLNSDPFVAVFIGSSVPEKCWGVDRFSQLVGRLSDFGFKALIIGGEGERAAGVVAVGSKGLNLAGMTSLAETAAVIARSSLVVSGDSGVLHIAASLDIPTVSLFGPSSAEKWAPRGERHIVIKKDLPCSPCSKFGTIPACPIHVQCMRDITVDEVFNAVTMLLTSTGALSSRCCKRDWIETV